MTHQRTFLTGGLLILVVICLSALTFYLSLGPCPSGSFKCDNGTKCVAQRKICDKHRDCEDGEDEHKMTCGMVFGGRSLEEWMLERSESIEDTHRICNVRLEGCRRKCDPVPTMLCRGRNFTGLPRVINDFPGNPNVSTPTDPLRIIMPHNRVLLLNSTFASVALERLDLSWNGIKRVPRGAFAGQRHLRQLYLRNNHIEEAEEGSFSGLTQLEWLFLEDNRLAKFPLEDLADSGPSLMWLNLSNNHLRLDDGQSFPELTRLWDLHLDNNRIEDIGRHTFSKLVRLEVLGLSGNLISYIHPLAFETLRNLRDLSLSHNRLTVLPENFLLHNSFLEVLHLNNNPRINVQLSHYGELPNITSLNLEGISADQIDFSSINRLPNLLYATFEKFHSCSKTPRVLKCRPTSDGISSYANLLENTALRYSAWMMVLLTCLGNALVLWVRSTFREENKSVSTVIRNLAIADLFMGLYLLVIAVQDVRYRDVYHREAGEWVGSWACAASGIIAMVSSEVSLLILAFMSMDRFLVIADPFGAQNRVTCRRMAAPLMIIWFLGTAVSVAPAIYYRSSSKFYGIYSGTCFPLHLEELYPVGWQYSAFLFFGLNLFLLVVMVTLYSGLLYSIRRTRCATPLPFKDCEITIRFFFIVLTSASCWASIIGFKLLAFVGYEFGLDIYAFVVIYLLPLNSAINPLLYTFTTPHYMQRIVARHWRNFFQLKCDHHHHRILTNGNCGSGAGTRATHNYYSNPEESLEKRGRVPGTRDAGSGSGSAGICGAGGILSSPPSSTVAGNNSSSNNAPDNKW